MMIYGGLSTLVLGPLGAVAVGWAAHALTPEEEVENNPQSSKPNPADIVDPADIVNPEEVVRWVFLDRGKKVCEFDSMQAFMNMSARLVQGAPFPLEDVIVRHYLVNGNSIDVSFVEIAEMMFNSSAVH